MVNRCNNIVFNFHRGAPSKVEFFMHILPLFWVSYTLNIQPHGDPEYTRLSDTVRLVFVSHNPT